MADPLDKTHARSHHLEQPQSPDACLWTVGGGRRTQREPTRAHGEHVNTAHDSDTIQQIWEKKVDRCGFVEVLR